MSTGEAITILRGLIGFTEMSAVVSQYFCQCSSDGSQLDGKVESNGL